MLIAVDGPAASGKGTIARALAQHFHLPHLDTGLLYRAVGVTLLRKGFALTDTDALRAACAAPENFDFPDSLLNDDELRTADAAQAASIVSALPQVRSALFARQQAFAHQPGGAVLDGRDIGTVVAPEADVKLYVTADLDTRAARRMAEAAGKGLSRDEVRTDLANRDARDRGRASAPLRQAPDAVLLDTTKLSIAEGVRRAIALVEDRTER